MSKYKVGDRVTVMFEAEVVKGRDNSTFSVSYPGNPHVTLVLHDSWVTSVTPALPDGVGSVIHISKWSGYDENWTALKVSSGKWHISVDDDALYTQERMQGYANDGQMAFTILHEQKEEA